MERFSSLISNGIRRVWEGDAKSQHKFLDVIASARNTQAKLLQDVGAFFVPNGQYLIKYFSPEIQDPDFDCYGYDGVCKWQNNLVIPIYDLADEIVGLGGFNPFLYDVLGLDLTPDVALASIAMPKALLSISPAGGGKTTWAQVQAILYKLLYPNPKKPSQKVSGGRILCLVYNRHNVQDMVTRHEQMVTRLRLANIKGLDIDDQINASTMHSFCDFIRKKYVAKLNMVGFSLLDDDYSVRMMERSVRIGYKKMKKTVPSSLSVANLLSFYVLCRESMKDPRDMQESDKFLDLGLPLDEIEAVFEQYESAKKIGRRYDYVDMLTSIAGLLERDRGVLEDVQRYFHVIIADEVQDFTPVMWRLLQLFVSDGTPLTCIGDEDQCIYQFRGASIEDLLLFSGRFSGGKVYSLLRNRRCRNFN